MSTIAPVPVIVSEKPGQTGFSGYMSFFCQTLHNLLQTRARMVIKQNPLLYIVRIDHLQFHTLAEELFVVILARQMNQTGSSHYVCTHALVLHSDFVFPVDTDS